MNATPRRRKILYVANLGGTTALRLEAMKRLGQEVLAFDVGSFLSRSRLLEKIRYRYPVGPLIARANDEILRTVSEYKPDVVWFDKPLVFTTQTILKIKTDGAQTVCFNQDNPFGPRNDGCWMQFYRVYKLFDLNCLFRTVDVARYEAERLPYIKLQFSFDREENFPPPDDWTDEQRTRGISFTGSPYDNRAAFLMTLAENYHLPIQITGPNWQRVLNKNQFHKYVTGGLLPSSAYRENIWKSKVNLAFVTHSNEDDVAHKAFEIAACGSFLLAERTPGHVAAFEEDKEAVFFSSVEECAEKARYYLEHENERNTIAQSGRERAIASGYDNDTQLKRALLKLDDIETPATI